MFRDCCSGIFAGLITDSAEALKTDIHNLRLNTSMNKSTQRAQTSTSAKIWNKSDPWFESWFPD